MRRLTLGELSERVHSWCQELHQFGTIELVRTEATIGGGSLPGQSFESIGIAINHPKINDLQRLLLSSKPPIIGRIQNQQFIFDARAIITLQQEAPFLNAIKSTLTSLDGPAN